MKHIINIAWKNIPGGKHSEIPEHAAYEKISLTDGDIIIFSPKIEAHTSYDGKGSYKGLPLLSSSAFSSFENNLDHWKKRTGSCNASWRKCLCFS